MCDGVLGVVLLSSGMVRQSCAFRESALSAVVKETSRRLLLWRKVRVECATVLDQFDIESFWLSQLANDAHSRSLGNLLVVE